MEGCCLLSLVESKLQKLALGASGLKFRGVFKKQGKASPVTAVTWIIQVGGPSLRPPLHALFITLLPRALVLSQEDGVRIPALPLW